MDTWMVKSYRLSLLIFITYLILQRSHGAELQVVAHPKDSIVATGGNATLECKFNMEVSKCFWFEDFFKEVKLSKYNVYSDTRTNGTNTKDCTLIIHSFSRAIDANCFYCLGTMTKSGYYSAIASRKGCLSLQTTDTSADTSIIAGPKNASVQEGDSVIMSCTFNIPVLSCGWIRNDRKDLQPIYDRYEYINFGRATNNSGDCSIRINQFKEMDAVNWMCYAQRVQGASIDIIKSNWAKLTFVPKIQETTTEITTTTDVMTTEIPTTETDQTTLSLTEATSTESSVLPAHVLAGEYVTLVTVATVTLVLVLLVILLQGGVMYFIKYRMQSYSKYQVDTINLPRIEKQNLLE